MAQTKRFWLVVGKPINWKTAFKEGNTWGLKDTLRQRTLWEKLKEGDTVIFYATSPVSGVIGYGKVTVKFKQDKPLWPEEIKKKQVIWPLRFEFDILYCFPPNEWVFKKYGGKDVRNLAVGGFRRIDEVLATKIMDYLYSVSRKLPVPVKVPTDVGALKDKILEIGKMQKFIVEKDFITDDVVLDVVWRRVERSVPTYVFEIKLEGDLNLSLAKLKHAYDLWNSHIFLITTPQNKLKAESLLSGTFHEIRERLKIIEIEEIHRLYNLKRQYKELEERLGIL